MTPQNYNLLTSVDGVALLRRSNRRAIYKLVDGGTLFDRGLEWVFNIAVDATSPKRELRFWTREILAPETVAGLSLEQVLGNILPTTIKNFHSGHAVQILMCDYQHLRNLKSARVLPSDESTPRPALVKFLTQRLVQPPLKTENLNLKTF